jgi:[acyl-carrier-protein] S-malonyltransferase
VNFIALFPGQGSQHVGMAKDLLDQFSAAREVFEEASDAIDLDLRHLCLNGPESDLTLTENTQPALLAASVAAFRVTQKETGFTPRLAAGHSLGEYSALVAVGSLGLAAATRFVRARGQAMQKAVPAGEGTMAAVLGLDDESVREICAHATARAQENRQKSGQETELTVDCIVEPANFNSPGQVVIAGSTDAVNEAVSLIKSGTLIPGGKAMPLSVSAPFHCRLMRPARDRIAEIFSKAAEPASPACPYVPNRTGRLTTEPGAIFELLMEQIDHPVLWRQSMQTVLESGTIAGAVEFGPGKVLSGLMKRIAAPLDKKCELLNVADGATLLALDKRLQGTTT